MFSHSALIEHLLCAGTVLEAADQRMNDRAWATEEFAVLGGKWGRVWRNEKSVMSAVKILYPVSRECKRWCN